MDNNKFDNIIKGKLDALSSDSAPRWDLFKEKLQAQDVKRADRDFDNSIRKNVSEVTVDYDPNHWSLLKSRLERIYAVRKSVFTVKSYEVIAILLLTFAVSTHYEFLFDTSTSPTAMLSETNADDLSSDNIINAGIATASASTNREIAVREYNRNTTEEESIGTVVQVVNSAVSNNLTTQNINNNETLQSVDYSSALRTESRQIQNIAASEIVSGPSEDHSASATPVALGHITDSQVANDNTNDHIALASLATLKAQSITGLADRDIVTINDNQFGIKPVVATPTQKFVHVVASFDNNIISTPFNEQYNSLGPVKAEMFGFSVSGLFSLQKDKWEYETGFAYSLYNKPANIAEYWDDNAGGVFKYAFSNVNYNILSVPLRVKYHFVTNPDWSLFVSGGLSPEFIVNTGYEESSEQLNIQVPIPMNTEPGTTIYEEGPFRRNNNFHNGLFQKGSFSENFMLRAHVGFGMQRNITPSLSAYFSGQIYKSVLTQTYGPTDDTINKFSISFGLREKF